MRLLLEALEERLAPASDLPFYQPPTHTLLDHQGFLTGPAQGAALDLALNFLEANASQLDLSPADLAEPVVTNQYVSPATGVTHIYLRQTWAGLNVVNAVLNVNVSALGEIINVGSSFVNGITATSAPNPVLSALSAVTASAASLGLVTSSVPSLVQSDTETLFAAPELSLDPIPARLAYVAQPDGLHLAWNTVLRTPDGDHWYNAFVDATDGDLLLASDWASHAAAYDVLPLPGEDPDDTTRSLLGDPADPLASPFGWHDTNGLTGAEFTDTRGNNVFAQEDTDGNNSGGFRPNGGANLQFDFPLDLTQQPAAYQSASITNLFYVNNVLHDVHYQYGFTEDAGNFQQFNYTGQGLGGDAVQADAQDGSGTNNANFSTPPDGQAPRMQMFRWTLDSVTSVQAEPLGQSYQAGTAAFGPSTFQVTGDLVLAEDGTNPDPNDASDPLTNNVAGKIVLIDRGLVTFKRKALHAQNAGAIGVVIANNVAGAPPGMANDASITDTITIPLLSISLADGDTLKTALQAGAVSITLKRGSAPARDSALDNAIIVHEYGHGVSNRLTGGPANADALDARQSGGMGEGWSDWWGLMFTQRASDTPATPRPVAAYLVGSPSQGPGIRRVPYSFDMTVNPLTFNDYNVFQPYNPANSTSTNPTEVHNSGEIWASALWDLNWLLIGKYGFDANLHTGYQPGGGPASAGNKLALQLVMDGLKLQPANPSFTDARNAILLADRILTGGQNLREIWTAFARRGLGFTASTSSAIATTVTTDFSLPPELSNPAVVGVTPAGTVAVAPTTLSFTFSEPMAPGSFDATADVLSFAGPAGNDLRAQITGASFRSGNTILDITFNAPVTPGKYTLVLGPQVLAADNASPLDQDSDGLTGEADDDAFTAVFFLGDSTLAVAATRPGAGTTITAGSLAVEVDFTQPLDPASVGVDDVQLTVGQVASAVLVDADTVRYTLTGIADISTELTFQLPHGVVRDLAGFPVRVFGMSFPVQEIGALALPTPFVPVAPLGSLVYETTLDAQINTIGDVDRLTVPLEAGLRVTVHVEPVAGLQPVVELRSPTEALLAQQTAAAAGQDVILPLVPTTGGTYAIVVRAANNTTGRYKVRVVLDAALEAEQRTGASNDTLATAQPLDNDFIALGGGAATTAVLGKADRSQRPIAGELEPNDSAVEATLAAGDFAAVGAGRYQLQVNGSVNAAGDLDFFRLGELQTGDVLTIALAGFGAGRGTLDDAFVQLLASDEAVVIGDDDSGPPGGHPSDALVYRFVIPATDTYYVRASGLNDPPSTFPTGSYQLALYLEDAAGAAPTTGGTFTTETGSNDTVATANDASTSWRPVQFRSQIAGFLEDDGSDFFEYRFSAGDLVTITADALGATLDAAVTFLNANLTTLARDNGASTGAGLDAPIYAVRIPASGIYYVQVSGRGQGDYRLDVDLSSATPPANNIDGLDLYSFPLAAGESVTLGLEALSAGTLHLALLDSTGTLVAAGVAGASNLDEIIANFTGAPGLYYARVTGDTAVEYNLGVTRNAAFDAEPNDALASAQPLTGAGVLGHLSAGAEDWYQFAVSPGTRFTLTTSTPGGGAGEFVNMLDPRLELFTSGGSSLLSDDNSAIDGRNAQLAWIAMAPGTYRVRVQGVNSGEYFLRLSQTANLAPLGSDFTKLGVQGLAVAFVPADFSARTTDLDNDLLAAVRIESLPGVGTLMLGSTAVAPGQVVAVADLGSLVYTPPPAFLGSTSFTWRPFDGFDFAAASSTVSIVVGEPPPLAALQTGSVFDPRSVVVLALQSVDPVQQWTIDWGDGTVMTVPGGNTTVTHAYPLQTATWTIRVTATQPGGGTEMIALTAQARFASANAAFVARAFLDLAGVPIDAGRLALFTAQLDAGMIAVSIPGRKTLSPNQRVTAARQSVVLQIFATPEYRTRVARDLYLRLLNRLPTDGELAVALSLSDRDYTGKALLLRLLSSPEYAARNGGGRAAFQAALARDVLGRPRLPAEITAAGGARRQLVRRLLENVASRLARLDALSVQLFGAPTASAVRRRARKDLLAGKTVEGLFAQLVAGDDYFVRSAV